MAERHVDSRSPVSATSATKRNGRRLPRAPHCIGCYDAAHRGREPHACPGCGGGREGLRRVPGLKEEQKRKDVIAFLEQFGPDGEKKQ